MIVTCVCTDEENKKIIDLIQRSAFIVCLDNPVQFRSDRFSALLNNIHHGNGTAYNSGNRWFDKTLQVSDLGWGTDVWNVL